MGDPPLELRWLKDEGDIPGELGIQITQDAYSSTLAISRVSRAHSGNYTCIASNDGRSGRVTAPLVVSGTVKYLYLSVSVSHCIAADAPPPTLLLASRLYSRANIYFSGFVALCASACTMHRTRLDLMCLVYKLHTSFFAYPDIV